MEGRGEGDSGGGYEAETKDEEPKSTSPREAAHNAEDTTTKKKHKKKEKGKHKEESEDLGHEQEENSTREMKEKEERDSARAEGKGSSSELAKKKRQKKKEKSNEEKLDQEVRKSSTASSNLRPVRKLRNLFYVVDGSRSLMLDCLQEPPPYLADNEFEGHEIIPSLFLGDYSSASKRDALKERKVTHIINCARIARKWFPEDFTYHHLEIDDHPMEDILTHLDRCCAIINEARQGGGAVLVHCMAGISRSASVVVAYLVKFEKMPLPEALRHAKEIRTVVNPNPGFMQQLEWYEGMGCELRGTRSTAAHSAYRQWKRQKEGCLLA